MSTADVTNFTGKTPKDNSGEHTVEKPPWWMDAVKTLGLPTLFLGVMTYAVWSAGIWAGQTIVVPLFNKQIAFIDEATKMTQGMASSTQLISKTLEAQGQHAIEVLKLSQDIHNSVKDAKAQTDLNGERLKVINDSMLKTLEKIERNTQPIESLAIKPPPPPPE